MIWIIILLLPIVGLLFYIYKLLEQILWELKYGIEERKNLRESLPTWEAELKTLEEARLRDRLPASTDPNVPGNDEWKRKWGKGSDGEKLIKHLQDKIDSARETLSKDSRLSI